MKLQLNFLDSNSKEWLVTTTYNYACITSKSGMCYMDTWFDLFMVRF